MSEPGRRAVVPHDEAREILGIGGLSDGQKLQCHATSEPGVGRAINNAHPTRPKLIEYVVSADPAFGHGSVVSLPDHAPTDMLR